MERHIAISSSTLTEWLDRVKSASRSIGIIDEEVTGTGTCTDDALSDIDELGRQIAEVLGVPHPFGQRQRDPIPRNRRTTAPLPNVIVTMPAVESDEEVTERMRPSRPEIRQD